MRRSWLVLVFGLTLLAAPLPGAAGTRAWSQDVPEARHGPAHKQDTTHAEKGGEGAGHQDEGPFGRFALDLAVWTVVVFLVLLFVLGRFAWKPMLQGLEERERAIHSAVEDAQRAREEAQRLRDQLQQEMDRAHERIRAEMEEARRHAQENAEQMMARTKAEIQAERERLHREVETARDQALQQILNQTAQLAALVSTKAIRRQLNADDHRRLVDEALAELRQAGPDGQRAV